MNNSEYGQAGYIEIEWQGEHSAPLRLYGADPLKLLVPRCHEATAWIYTSTYGGGLVAGDAVDLNVTVQPQAQAVLTSQSATKIYSAADETGTTQRLRGSVGAGGLLVLAPEPVIPFGGARHKQHQRIDLQRTSGVVMIEGLAAGRIARGESWAFERYETCTELFMDGRLICRDAWTLEPAHWCDAPGCEVGANQCCMSVLLAGERLEPLAQKLVETINETLWPPQTSVVTAASPLSRGPGALIRAAGPSPRDTEAYVHELLSDLQPEIGRRLNKRKG
jgi:urease accessory protein